VPNLFPDIYPTVWEPSDDDYQSRVRAKNGFLQINTSDPVLQWQAKGSWQTLSAVKRVQIEDHWFSYKTSIFSLFNFWSRKIRGAFVAIGNGTLTTFPLPAKALVGATVKVNGVAANPQPTITEGTGPDGNAQATFSAAVANGAVITLDATEGRQLYEVNYLTENNQPRHREADVWTIDREFLQVVNG
jgi:hypothetical protein